MLASKKEWALPYLKFRALCYCVDGDHKLLPVLVCCQNNSAVFEKPHSSVLALYLQLLVLLFLFLQNPSEPQVGFFHCSLLNRDFFRLYTRY